MIPMALSEFTIKLVEQKLGHFCREKIPEMHRNRVKLGFKIEGNAVMLYEERPLYCDPLSWVRTDVARFRFDEETRQWTLHFPDRDFRWRLYYLNPKSDFEVLLREVDEDPLQIFWGCG
jgi:hypothetical protein